MFVVVCCALFDVRCLWLVVCCSGLMRLFVRCVSFAWLLCVVCCVVFVAS